jgi:reductive dehalogenase
MPLEPSSEQAEAVDSATLIEPEVVYRDQTKRYPWWVRSVDKPTVAIDRSTAKPMDFSKTTANLAARFFKRHNLEEMVNKYKETGLIRYIGVEKTIDVYKKKWVSMQKDLHAKKPGFNHEDWALMNAAFSVQYNFSFDFYELTKKTAFSNVSKSFDLGPWQGTKEEASKKVENAAIMLGAAQVGFTTVDPLFVYDGVPLDPEMKYAIVFFTRWSPEGNRRRDTALGAMDNRVCTSRENFTMSALRNFIRGLGYKETILRGPWPAYGIFAGLGEMGRMNRMVSPIFGAGGRVMALVTDLPLAIDKPIDFGLQEFCRHCKKCANACPAGAVSKAKEPSWEPQGEWNTPGTRVYYENSALCSSYLEKRSTICSLCMAACPWTKQAKTSLHQISKTISSRLPFLAKLMVYMDDLFGYGPTGDLEELEKWWDLDISEFGLDPYQH